MDDYIPVLHRVTGEHDPDSLGFLLDLLRGPSWMADAACKGMDTDLFYSERGEWGALESPAMAVCRECPVRAECLEYAIERCDDIGVWGGTSGKKRQELRRKIRRAS